jgi:hypothetical protein
MQDKKALPDVTSQYLSTKLSSLLKPWVKKQTNKQTTTKKNPLAYELPRTVVCMWSVPPPPQAHVPELLVSAHGTVLGDYSIYKTQGPRDWLAEEGPWGWVLKVTSASASDLSLVPPELPKCEQVGPQLPQTEAELVEHVAFPIAMDSSLWN